jgi:hypothetical protein
MTSNAIMTAASDEEAIVQYFDSPIFGSAGSAATARAEQGLRPTKAGVPARTTDHAECDKRGGIRRLFRLERRTRRRGLFRGSAPRCRWRMGSQLEVASRRLERPLLVMLVASVAVVCHGGDLGVC